MELLLEINCSDLFTLFLLPYLLLCNHYKFLCNLSVSRDGHE